jgi:hypothetical protein
MNLITTPTGVPVPPQPELLSICEIAYVAAVSTMDMAAVAGVTDDGLDSFIEDYCSGGETPQTVLGDRIGIFIRIRQMSQTLDQLSSLVSMLAPHVGILTGMANAASAKMMAQQNSMIQKIGRH